MNETIKTLDHPLYQLLKEEKVEEFNEAKKSSDSLPSFEFGDFRGLNLQGLDAEGLNFASAYFRGADLRGIDFRKTQLEGASIAGAQISGCFFPKKLSSDEIVMSLNHGTRMRYTLPTTVNLVKKSSS